MWIPKFFFRGQTEQMLNALLKLVTALHAKKTSNRIQTLEFYPYLYASCLLNVSSEENS